MTTEELYIAFRREQGNQRGIPYKMPKDIGLYIELKMNKPSQEALKTASLWFSTKWQNIDVTRFMKYGFELFGKSFTYTKFFDPNLMKFYIQKDRNEKLNAKHTKKELLESFTFIFEFMKDRELNSRYGVLENYCKLKDGEKFLILEHYIKNKVSSLVFIYLMKKRYIILTDDMKILVPHLVQQQRELVYKIDEYKELFEKVEKQLDNRLQK